MGTTQYSAWVTAELTGAIKSQETCPQGEADSAKGPICTRELYVDLLESGKFPLQMWVDLRLSR